MSTLLFFYGTLKRGCRNHVLLAGQEFVRSAWTWPRYRLYDCGPYPALVEAETGGRAIHGELWRIDAAVLTRLDEFEQVGHMFERRDIHIEDNEYPVYAYFYRENVTVFPDCGAEWSEI